MNIFRHFTSNVQKKAIFAPQPSEESSSPSPFHHPSTNHSTTHHQQKNQHPPKSEEKKEKEKNDREDVELVRKAQAGDQKAFAKLVSKHQGIIYAMILKMVKNDADAWDISQDVFVKVWKALPKFENRAKFSTWIFRITHNAVYDWNRKHHIKSDSELNDEVLHTSRIDPSSYTTPHQNDSPSRALERREQRHAIHSAINQLSPDHREVILLREVQGMDYKEIAEITHSSIGTVMSRIHYARKKLQTLLMPASNNQSS